MGGLTTGCLVTSPLEIRFYHLIQEIVPEVIGKGLKFFLSHSAVATRTHFFRVSLPVHLGQYLTAHYNHIYIINARP